MDRITRAFLQYQDMLNDEMEWDGFRTVTYIDNAADYSDGEVSLWHCEAWDDELGIPLASFTYADQSERAEKIAEAAGNEMWIDLDGALVRGRDF